jgi:hypothetical protein
MPGTAGGRHPKPGRRLVKAHKPVSQNRCRRRACPVVHVAAAAMEVRPYCGPSTSCAPDVPGLQYGWLQDEEAVACVPAGSRTAACP